MTNKPTTDTWYQTTPIPFYTTQGLPWWKRFNEKNWLPQCLYCAEKPIFTKVAQFNAHFVARHGITSDDK